MGPGDCGSIACGLFFFFLCWLILVAWLEEQLQILRHFFHDTAISRSAAE